MLSREHAIANCDFQQGVLWPDRLTRQTHSAYLRHAHRMQQIYRHGIGQTRHDLHCRIYALLAPMADCPTRRIRAFCKLLDDGGRFRRDRRGAAAQLREVVFRLAATRHPLVQTAAGIFQDTEAAVKDEIANRIGRTWDEVQGDLYADVPDFQRLEAFEGYPDDAALLARYNVGQVQVALFDATRLVIRAREDFKTILRHAKLAGLMHTVRRRSAEEYEIQLDGPASVLRRTHRYGAAMARLIPKLLTCRDWRLYACLVTRRSGWKLRLELSSTDGLTSHLSAPNSFDSKLEEDFATRWGSLARDGWTLRRETTILHHNQTVFLPDFELRHRDGRRVLLEIVGFWTPEYLAAKQKTLARFAHELIVLAVPHKRQQTFESTDFPVVPYKNNLEIGDVLRCVEGISR